MLDQLTPLRPNEITINRECVLNSTENAPIYRIKAVFQNEAQLSYVEGGVEKIEGFHSQSTLYHPTDEQRAYWATQK